MPVIIKALRGEPFVGRGYVLRHGGVDALFGVVLGVDALGLEQQLFDSRHFRCGGVVGFRHRRCGQGRGQGSYLMVV
jgi:hypothetical protein